MSPAAQATNILQAEADATVGWQLPTINLLTIQLNRVKLQQKYCRPLVDAIQMNHAKANWKRAETTSFRAELMKMMIFILLLFISLPCSVCETLEVSCTLRNQDFNGVTLELRFPNRSLDSLEIFCRVTTDHDTFLFEYNKGEEFTYGPFEVQQDKSRLGEGQMRLHVSFRESALYRCDVETREGSGSASCDISVTDKPQTTPETKTGTGPEPGLWIGLGIGLTVLVLICVCVFTFIYIRAKRPKPVNGEDAESGDNEADRVQYEAEHERISLNHKDETSDRDVNMINCYSDHHQPSL